MVNAADVTLGDSNYSDAYKVCYIEGVSDASSDYSGYFGARISSIFVIFFVSTFVTVFPLLATRFKRLKIPLYGYLFARYFGTGVIIATAYVHLMDPAYGEIGPNTCVGMTGNWAVYSWPPAIILVSIVTIFLTDLIASVIVERKYGVDDEAIDVLDIIVAKQQKVAPTSAGAQEDKIESSDSDKEKNELTEGTQSISETEIEISFEKQFNAFLILEAGIIFHSIMIGLNLGSVDGGEFPTLYIVLVFHQSFEGLGIGARLSAIPWPKEKPSWIPWALCVAYGLVTPIGIAIGLGVRKTYSDNSFTVNIVSGVLDSISAGILMYTGMVELLARDFIFDKNRTKDLKQLTFMVMSTLWGCGIMALLGKWA